MAKYTITRACGHEEVVELYGPTKSRELRIKYLEQELCSECLDEQRAEQAKEDREKSLAEGYPELLGSPRQIQWAEQIRREFIDWIDSLEFVDDAEQDAVVYLVESVPVDVEGLQGMAGYVKVDEAVAFHHCEIPDSAQQGVCHTRCAAAAHRDLVGRLSAAFDAEKGR